jgi:hypothetical protein
MCVIHNNTPIACKPRGCFRVQPDITQAGVFELVYSGIYKEILVMTASKEVAEAWAKILNEVEEPAALLDVVTRVIELRDQELRLIMDQNNWYQDE